jgi:hypothetical protein
MTLQCDRFTEETHDEVVTFFQLGHENHFTSGTEEWFDAGSKTLGGASIGEKPAVTLKKKKKKKEKPCRAAQPCLVATGFSLSSRRIVNGTIGV